MSVSEEKSEVQTTNPIIFSEIVIIEWYMLYIMTESRFILRGRKRAEISKKMGVSKNFSMRCQNGRFKWAHN